MPLVHADRVKETSTTTGTGTYDLAGAVSAAFRTFVAGIGNGNTCYYFAIGAGGWEAGIGTITDASPDTLARTQILASSNSGSAVDWPAGTRTLFCGIPATIFALLKQTGLETIWLPAAAWKPANTNGAAWGAIEGATYKDNTDTLDFDGTSAEYATGKIGYPKSWNLSTITYLVVWRSSATDTDGVAWTLEGVARGDGDDTDAAWGTAVTVTDAAQSSATKEYHTAASAAVTVAGTPAQGDLVSLRLGRNPSHASDTMAEDARFIGMWVFYTSNAVNDS